MVESLKGVRQMTRNNNWGIIFQLAKVIRKQNRSHYRLILMTVALSIVVISMIFGLARGRYDAEYLQSIRSVGNIATTILERGTESQYRQLKQLKYLDKVGRSYSYGSVGNQKQLYGTISYLQGDTWEEFILPTVTDVVGHYPTKADEVMLSRRLLDKLEIKNPKLQMPVQLSIQDSQQRWMEKTFYLSGWFTEYLDPHFYLPPAYIGPKNFDMKGKAATVFILQRFDIDEIHIEERLYRDVQMVDSYQQFLGGNTIGYTILTGQYGNYKVAIIGTVLFLISICFLIYNIFHLSIHRQLRQIGLLEIIGTTRKQIVEIFLVEIIYYLFWGSLFGSIFSAAILKYFIPKILGNMYLHHFGQAKNLEIFRLEWIGLAILLVALTLLGVQYFVIYLATKHSPLENYHYLPKNLKYHRRKQITNHLNQQSTFRTLLAISKRQVFSSLPRFIITCLSLFLSFSMVLGAIIITKGSDYRYSIEKRPDFHLLANSPNMAPEAMHREYQPIRDEVYQSLRAMPAVNLRQSYIVKGTYALISNHEKIFQVLQKMSAAEATKSPNSLLTIQVLSEKEMQSLHKYASEHHLPFNNQSVKSGDGIVFMHYHVLSPKAQQIVQNEINTQIQLYHLPKKEENIVRQAGEIQTGPFEQIGTIKIASCLDSQLKDFPRITHSWYGPGVLYGFVTKKGMEKLKLSTKILAMNLNVESSEERTVHSNLMKIVQDENAFRPFAQLNMSSKSEELKEASEYIRIQRLIVLQFSLALVFVCLANFFNILFTLIYENRREWLLYQAVGMTQTQLKFLLSMIGFIYFLAVSILQVTLGNIVIEAVKQYLKNQLYYFRFFYPWQAMLWLFIGFLLLCIVLPQFFYWQLKDERPMQQMN